MTVSEVIAREATAGGVLLVAGGLTSLSLRRHLVSNLLGVFLLILGGVVIVCHKPTPAASYTGAVVLVASTVMAPVVLAAFANWRAARGIADQSSLAESIAEEVDEA